MAVQWKMAALEAPPQEEKPAKEEAAGKRDKGRQKGRNRRWILLFAG